VTPATEPLVAAAIAAIGSFPAENGFIIVAAGARTGLTPYTYYDAPLMQSALQSALDAAKTQASDRASSKPSTKRSASDWQVVVRPKIWPTFSADEADAANGIVLAPSRLLFAPSDIVELPAGPTNNMEDSWRTLEWWHYQHECSYKQPWGELVAICGLSQTVVGAVDPEIAPGDGRAYTPEDITVVPRGIGYPPEDLPDDSGGAQVGEVEKFEGVVASGG